MISLNVEHECLLNLLKAALFNSLPETNDDVNWDKVFELARAQCVVPLVTSYVPSEYRDKWLEVSNQSKVHYLQMLYEQSSLVNLMNKNDIPFVILKGTAAAIYYPVPSLRTYGDIDFLVPEEHFELSAKLLEKNDYSYFYENDRHYEYMKNGIEFELHSKFSIEYYNDIDHILLDGLNNSVDYILCGYSFPGLPAYENGLVLLGHIMQHLKIAGIGLRQILDWMMFVHNKLDDSAWENNFRSLASEAGLEKLAITITFMCKKWLGLPNEITWCNEADEDVADQFLIRILDDGNFGHDRAPYEVVRNTTENEGVFAYLQRAGMINWKLAQKLVFLRPLAWLYQLCRYGRKGVYGIVTGRKLFMKNKHNMTIEELLEKLE